MWLSVFLEGGGKFYFFFNVLGGIAYRVMYGWEVEKRKFGLWG